MGNEPTHYVSDQIAEGPRTPELPESRYEAALQLWWEWFEGGGRAVPPIPDDTSLMLQWIVGRFRAATRETRGTPPQLDLLKQWWEIGKLILKHEPIPEDEVATLMFETEIAFAAARGSQPVAPPPPNSLFFGKPFWELQAELREKFNAEIVFPAAEPVAPGASAAVKMSGFLDYRENDNGWKDSIALLDEGTPGEMGGMPLVMNELKQFHGKEVMLTVKLHEKCEHGYSKEDGWNLEKCPSCRAAAPGASDAELHELVNLVEKNVGHCCGDMLKLSADDLLGILKSARNGPAGTQPAQEREK